MKNKHSFFMGISILFILFGSVSCLDSEIENMGDSITENTQRCLYDATKNLSANDCNTENIRKEAFQYKDKIKEIVPLVDKVLALLREKLT